MPTGTFHGADDRRPSDATAWRNAYYTWIAANQEDTPWMITATKTSSQRDCSPRHGDKPLLAGQDELGFAAKTKNPS